jgi:hypothetical protein
MQAGDVGQEHTVSMRVKCLARRHAPSRHFTLHVRGPAPAAARIRGIGEAAAATVVHAEQHAAVDRFGSSY